MNDKSGVPSMVDDLNLFTLCVTSCLKKYKSLSIIDEKTGHSIKDGTGWMDSYTSAQLACVQIKGTHMDMWLKLGPGGKLNGCNNSWSHLTEP